ncbi:hypothetical protein ACFSCX_11425 [Bacillus salitolerans]|uniref:Uncharacterized protein n=1 Tax=Bacillus salitolerans TaxID=1437434 RepID=A0ABW4LQ03_9BACI
MELKENMIFSITDKFIPNFSKAKTLRILYLNEKTVKVELSNSTRGAFPIEQFKGLIRNESLILSKEVPKVFEVLESPSEDTA